MVRGRSCCTFLVPYGRCQSQDTRSNGSHLSFSLIQLMSVSCQKGTQGLCCGTYYKVEQMNILFKGEENVIPVRRTGGGSPPTGIFVVNR